MYNVCMSVGASPVQSKGFPKLKADMPKIPPSGGVFVPI